MYTCQTLKEEEEKKTLFASNLDSHGLYVNLIASKMHIWNQLAAEVVHLK